MYLKLQAFSYIFVSKLWVQKFGTKYLITNYQVQVSVTTSQSLIFQVEFVDDKLLIMNYDYDFDYGIYYNNNNLNSCSSHSYDIFKEL